MKIIGQVLFYTQHFWGRKKWWENEIFEGKNEHLLLGVQQGLVVQVDEGHWFSILLFNVKFDLKAS